MIRSRFRDFDWMLLGFVLLLSVVSVLEIRSATAMTKFHGFQQKQMVFLAVGVVGMFAISLVDYPPPPRHRVLGVRRKPGLPGRSAGRGPEGPRRTPLDQPRRRCPLPTIRVGQARPHPRLRPLLLGDRRQWPPLVLEGHRQGIPSHRRAAGDGAEAARPRYGRLPTCPC